MTGQYEESERIVKSQEDTERHMHKLTPICRPFPCRRSPISRIFDGDNTFTALPIRMTTILVKDGPQCSWDKSVLSTKTGTYSLRCLYIQKRVCSTWIAYLFLSIQSDLRPRAKTTPRLRSAFEVCTRPGSFLIALTGSRTNILRWQKHLTLRSWGLFLYIRFRLLLKAQTRLDDGLCIYHTKDSHHRKEGRLTMNTQYPAFSPASMKYLFSLYTIAVLSAVLTVIVTRNPTPAGKRAHHTQPYSSLVCLTACFTIHNS